MMSGYLGETPLAPNEWYNTKDIGYLDSEGFLFIIDCISRFSKIGGEMVPHLKIEEKINNILGCRAALVVSQVFHDRNREDLAVLYHHETVSPEELFELLNQTSLPKLWIPKCSFIFKHTSIPMLGFWETRHINSERYCEEKISGNAGREADRKKITARKVARNACLVG